MIVSPGAAMVKSVKTVGRPKQTSFAEKLATGAIPVSAIFIESLAIQLLILLTSNQNKPPEEMNKLSLVEALDHK